MSNSTCIRIDDGFCCRPIVLSNVLDSMFILELTSNRLNLSRHWLSFHVLWPFNIHSILLKLQKIEMETTIRTIMIAIFPTNWLWHGWQWCWGFYVFIVEFFTCLQTETSSDLFMCCSMRHSLQHNKIHHLFAVQWKLLFYQPSWFDWINLKSCPPISGKCGKIFRNEYLLLVSKQVFLSFIPNGIMHCTVTMHIPFEIKWFKFFLINQTKLFSHLNFF